MRKVLASALSLLLFILVSGCCTYFSDVPAAVVYHVGDTIPSSPTQISVEQFQWANGQWTTAGSARADTRNYSQGSGADLNANNVNLHFLFQYPVKQVTLKFGELGGNVNLKVNDDFKNTGNFTDLNGTVVGGATVTVSASQQPGGNWHGTLTVTGIINGFAVGGQELWIDDVCASK